MPLVCNQTSENQYSLCDTAFSYYYFIISYCTSPHFSAVAACCIAARTQGMRSRLSANPGATDYSLLASLSHGVKIWRDSSCGGNWHGTHCSRAVWLQMCWTWQTPTEIYQTGSILAALRCPRLYIIVIVCDSEEWGVRRMWSTSPGWTCLLIFRYNKDSVFGTIQIIFSSFS